MEKAINVLFGAVTNALVSTAVGGIVGVLFVYILLFSQEPNLMDSREPAYTLFWGTVTGLGGGVVPSFVLGGIVGAIYGYRQKIIPPKTRIVSGIMAGFVGGLLGAAIAYFSFMQ
ncbi:MAG: hypothetical protein R3D55_00290 [Chloroflexota bacterium]